MQRFFWKRFLIVISLVAFSFSLLGCQNKEVIIDLFNEKLLAVEKNNTWGYINTKGDTKIEFFYDLAGAFKDGIAVVCQNNRFFLINTSGDRITDVTYDFLEIDLETGLVWYVSDGKLGLMNAKGVALTDPLYVLLSGPYSSSVFSEGLAVVSLDGKYGYIDKTGNVKIPITFDSAGDFHQGRAVVKVGTDYGYIDKNGETVIGTTYYSASDFNEMKQAIVSTYNEETYAETYKVIDLSGNDVITGYDDIYDSSFGYVGDFAGKYYLLKKDGDKVDDIEYDDFYIFFDHIVVLLETTEESIVINNKWKTLYTFTEATMPDNAFTDNGILYFVVFNDDKTADLMYNNDTVLLTCDGISEIVGDRVVAKRYGMYGILSLKNKKIVEFDFDYLSIYNDGYILARVNGFYGILDGTGKIIVPFEYDSCTTSVHLNVQRTFQI